MFGRCYFCMTGVGEVISFSNYKHENILRMVYLYEGGALVSAAKLRKEAQQAQLHGTQTPNTCMPPPWLDY